VNIEARSREAVVSALVQLLERAGDRPELTEKARPVGDLGLESVDGIEFACALEDTLGLKIGDEVNPFIDDVEHRGRTVREIIDYVSKRLIDG